MKYRPREKKPKSKKIVVNVTEADHQFIKVVASHYGFTITRLVMKALRSYLKEKGEKKELDFEENI